MSTLFQDTLDVGRLSLTQWLHLLAVGCLYVRPHVIGAVAQADLQVFVAEDLLFIAKDGVGELGMECPNGARARLRWSEKVDMKRIIRVGDPCSAISVSLESAARW